MRRAEPTAVGPAMKDRLIRYLTHWDVHVLVVALVAAACGSAGAGSSVQPLEFSVAVLACGMVVPEVMLLAGACNERDDPRREAEYFISNQLAVLVIAVCVFTARRLLLP